MAKDFNSQLVVDGYDEHIRKLIPGYELIHQQIQSILKLHLQENAHVLIIGCGTGYELNYLLAAHPNCTFTVTELSENMLNQARQNVQATGQAYRVNFVLGSHTDFEVPEVFDAVLCILVTHFIEQDAKPLFLAKAFELLKPQGIFLSFDLMLSQSSVELEILPQFCQAQGLTKHQADKMMQRLADDFELISQSDYQTLLTKIGFEHIYCFSQIFSYAAYWAVKS